MGQYLDKFRGTIGSRQASQVLQLLNKKREQGQIRTMEEFSNQLNDLISELQSTKLQPSLKLYLAEEHSLIDSQQFNFMLDRVQDDLSSAFEEANNISKVQQAHEALIRDLQLKNLRAGIAELEAKISTYEIINGDNRGFDRALFSTFRESKEGRTQRGVGEDILFTDPRTAQLVSTTYDADVDLVGERLTLALGQAKTLHNIRGIRQIFEDDTPQADEIVERAGTNLRNIIDNTKGTYWIQELRFKEKKDWVNVKLELSLAAVREVNLIEIEPISHAGLYLEAIHYVDGNNVVQLLDTFDLLIDGPVGLQTTKIATNRIILTFRNEVCSAYESYEVMQSDPIDQAVVERDYHHPHRKHHHHHHRHHRDKEIHRNKRKKTRQASCYRYSNGPNRPRDQYTKEEWVEYKDREKERHRKEREGDKRLRHFYTAADVAGAGSAYLKDAYKNLYKKLGEHGHYGTKGHHQHNHRDERKGGKYKKVHKKNYEKWLKDNIDHCEVKEVLQIKSDEPRKISVDFGFVTGFDNIRVGLAQYAEQGIYVSTPIQIKDAARLGIRTLESRPYTDPTDGYTKFTTTTYDAEEGYIFLGSIEYWAVKRIYRADGSIAKVSTFPLLPIGTTRVNHERLVLNEFSSSDLSIEDVGRTIFFTTKTDGNVVVYRNGTELTNIDAEPTATDGWRIYPSETGGYASDKTPNSGNPMRMRIQILGGLRGDIYTVSYTPHTSSIQGLPEAPYSEIIQVGGLQVVDLVGDLSARAGTEQVVITDRIGLYEEGLTDKVYLVIILRQNTATQTLTPAVEEYTFLVGRKSMEKFEEL